jgi:hypothetical protein
MENRGVRITGDFGPGSLWGNDYCMSFNSKMRDKSLNGEIYICLQEAIILTRRLVALYNLCDRTVFGYFPHETQTVLRIA